eukprot:gnl/Chilomastix_cuspidata/2666.p1 GENE.gnl/Chilomastix_cuspidata/2666~~gnl/Chilomastix_cuspidata/2666.p1  ORF type:complete len:603 (+),score=70.13 gnl/Chilomastix_cuspidata/2666:108-1916(+)
MRDNAPCHTRSARKETSLPLRTSRENLHIVKIVDGLAFKTWALFSSRLDIFRKMLLHSSFINIFHLFLFPYAAPCRAASIPHSFLLLFCAHAVPPVPRAPAPAAPRRYLLSPRLRARARPICTPARFRALTRAVLPSFTHAGTAPMGAAFTRASPASGPRRAACAAFAVPSALGAAFSTSIAALWPRVCATAGPAAGCARAPQHDATGRLAGPEMTLREFFATLPPGLCCAEVQMMAERRLRFHPTQFSRIWRRVSRAELFREALVVQNFLLRCASQPRPTELVGVSSTLYTSLQCYYHLLRGSLRTHACVCLQAAFRRALTRKLVMASFRSKFFQIERVRRSLCAPSPTRSTVPPLLWEGDVAITCEVVRRCWVALQGLDGAALARLTNAHTAALPARDLRCAALVARARNSRAVLARVEADFLSINGRAPSQDDLAPLAPLRHHLRQLQRELMHGLRAGTLPFPHAATEQCLPSLRRACAYTQPFGTLVRITATPGTPEEARQLFAARAVDLHIEALQLANRVVRIVQAAAAPAALAPQFWPALWADLAALRLRTSELRALMAQAWRARISPANLGMYMDWEQGLAQSFSIGQDACAHFV